MSWNDAKLYVRWLSRKTEQRYRLLTEAEWEFVARAGMTSARYWGADIGRNNANCNDCGSRWDDRQTAPVGSFEPNAFGLHDVLGNVWEWVEDCWNDSYAGAPADGTAWTSGDCRRRVLRGGSWFTVRGARAQLIASATKPDSAAATSDFGLPGPFSPPGLNTRFLRPIITVVGRNPIRWC